MTNNLRTAAVSSFYIKILKVCKDLFCNSNGYRKLFLINFILLRGLFDNNISLSSTKA